MNTIDSSSIRFVKEQFNKRWHLNLQITKDQYDWKDLILTYKGKQIPIEVKQRTCKSDSYKTTIINKEKFDQLSSLDGILVVLFTDCWAILKVNKCFIQYKDFYTSATTSFANQSKAYRTKAELDLTKAKYFTYL